MKKAKYNYKRSIHHIHSTLHMQYTETVIYNQKKEVDNPLTLKQATIINILRVNNIVKNRFIRNDIIFFKRTLLPGCILSSTSQIATL